MSWEDTIAAISTPIGTGGIGIVRVSGSKAAQIAGLLFSPVGNRKAKDFISHKAYYGKITDPDTGIKVNNKNLQETASFFIDC